jgi:predicted RNA-binding Zn-ribbon protein involved in translation (DUF1610 family)
MHEAPICDICVEKGIYNVRMKDGTLQPFPDAVFACVVHGRLYNHAVGYQSEDDTTANCIRCEKCGEVSMYISSARPGATVYNCPSCGQGAPPPLR